MTRVIASGLFIALVVLAFTAGRLTATSRPAPEIPAAAALGAQSGPDRAQTEPPPTFEPTPTARPATPKPTKRPTPKPKPPLSLRATWYCLEGVSRCTVGYAASCYCAAISPDLKHLRGKWLTVSYGERSVVVRVVDCLCSRRGIDLYGIAFRQLAPLDLGVIRVRVG